MEQQNNSGNIWRTIAIIAICLLAIVSFLYATGRSRQSAAGTGEQTAAAAAETKQEAVEAEEQTDAAEGQTEQAPAVTDEPAVSGAEMLSLWTEDAPAKQALISYVEAVTDESSPDFIPAENRIAVFDLEETAQKIVTQNETGESFTGLEVDHGKCIASSFSGMTPAEFNSYIQEFKKLPMPSYDGMTRGGGWYQPMLQVVDYLQANDFTVYVVSGTDRFIVRGIVYDSPLHIPNRQIIGSDETLVAKDQGDVNGLDYVFDDDDELILGGEFIVKNLKMNKVTVIAQEIGEQPVLSFGNSTGDSSMAEYTTSRNPYKSLAFMLCCDDTEREYKSLAFMLCCDDTERENGNMEKADKMFSLCEEFDWVPVSMKNDWTTIYGDGVTKK